MTDRVASAIGQAMGGGVAKRAVAQAAIWAVFNGVSKAVYDDRDGVPTITLTGGNLSPDLIRALAE